jgi:ubiquinone/menaquinone biosynthesis C-methylase UbiE
MNPNILAGLLALALIMPVQAPAQSHHTAHHRFTDAEAWAKKFDDPARDEWQKPSEVIAALNLPQTAVIADIGAGTGYFAVKLARAVPQGRVLGIDTEPDMVRYLAERAKREALANISAMRANAGELRLKEPVDLILLVNVYHHIESRERYFRALRSSLKPGGRIAVIDFKPDSPLGPPPKHRIAAERVELEMRAASYLPQSTFTFLPHQYFLVFAPAGE